MTSLHASVLASFYQRSKGGAVITCGSKLMIALEFMGPDGNGGMGCDMVYADLNPNVQAVWQQRRCTPKDLGTAFLSGEDVEYIETTDEGEFKNLLSKYKRGATTQGLIDIKSGLRLYNVVIHA